jgi:hypothetical protein
MSPDLERFSQLYGKAIAAVLDVIATFGGREQRQGQRHQLDDLIKGARLEGAQKRFEFRERLFDRIEIRTVRGEEPEPRAGALDRDADLRLLVDREVVHDDDIAGAQRRDEDLVDVGEEADVIDRPVKHRGGRHAVEAQRGNDRARGPVTARGVVVEPEPARTAPVAAEQIGRDAALIKKHVLPRIAQGEPGTPLAPVSRDVGAALFVGVNRFF